jgi:hypothetical protein
MPSAANGSTGSEPEQSKRDEERLDPRSLVFFGAGLGLD